MLRTLKASVVGILAIAAADAATIYTPTAIDPTTTYGAQASCNTGPPCTPVLTFGTGGYYNALFSSTYKNGFQPALQAATQNIATNSGTVPVILNNESNTFGNWVSPAGTNRTSELVLDLGTFNGGVGSTMTNTGVFGVDKIWTMIQDNGVAAGSTISITLNGLNSLGNSVTDTVVLTAGTDFRGTSNTASVTSDAAGSGNTQATAAGSLTNGNQVYVSNNVFGALGPDTGSAFYYLDAQEIDLTNAFVGGYLDQIIVSGYSAGTQRITFNGLSLDEAQAPTPEPATLALFGLGLGLVAFRKMRRKGSVL